MPGGVPLDLLGTFKEHLVPMTSSSIDSERTAYCVWFQSLREQHIDMLCVSKDAFGDAMDMRT